MLGCFVLDSRISLVFWRVAERSEEIGGPFHFGKHSGGKRVSPAARNCSLGFTSHPGRVPTQEQLKDTHSYQPSFAGGLTTESNRVVGPQKDFRGKIENGTGIIGAPRGHSSCVRKPQQQCEYHQHHIHGSGARTVL